MLQGSGGETLSVLQRVLQAVRAGDLPALLLGKSQALGTLRDCIRDSFGWCRDEVKSLDSCLEGRVPLTLKCLTLWESVFGACCQLNPCTPLKIFSLLLPSNCEFGCVVLQTGPSWDTYGCVLYCHLPTIPGPGPGPCFVRWAFSNSLSCLSVC